MNKLNLPNKLTLLRIILVPICMACIMLSSPNESGDSVLPVVLGHILAAVVFVLTSLTDMLDGKIARKYNLITDFGKLMDPLADKMLVLGVFVSLISRFRANATLCLLLLIVTFITLFRELAVTSLRLVVSSKGNIVVAANWMGKVKTVSQIVTIFVLLIEPILPVSLLFIPSYVCLAFMTYMTIASGLNYFKAYWPYIDPTA